MTAVSEAVILMAGSGSRLRASEELLFKSLLPFQGRPLISRLLDTLARVGVKKIHAVVGYEHERLRKALAELDWAGIDFDFIYNPAWEKRNGISVLAAEKIESSPFLLAMSDHLWDESIFDRLLAQARPEELTVAMDRKIDSIFDLDDAMKLQTQGDRITAIGKELKRYDAIDTGLFVSPTELFTYLKRARQNEDCSLAEGVRLMAEEGKARGVDIGEAWWQDIDTPAMLEDATRVLARGKQPEAP